MSLVKEEKVTRCPKCNLIIIKLVSIKDDGKGQRVCRHCKKNAREKNDI